MPHSLTCALRIPFVAVSLLVLLWLPINLSSSQAHSAATAITNVPMLTPDHPFDREILPTPEAQQALAMGPTAQATSAVTITLRPGTAQMIQEFNLSSGIRSAALGPAIIVTNTVGLEPDCAKTNQIILPGRREVIYCYVIINTGSITMEWHTVTDDMIGTFFADTHYPLPPFGTPDSIAYITLPITVDKTIHNLLT